jgi:hypothetical protein
MGDREDSEEDESSLSLQEDISLSSISKERLQLGDEVATREDSPRGWACEQIEW